jgi:hypothetical protein
MGLNAGVGLVGIAPQSVAGTAAANPVYLHGVTAGIGDPISFDQAEIDVANGTREPVASQRTKFAAGIDFDSLVYAKAMVAWLKGAFGTNVTTGSANPYTHTGAIGATLPLLTLFSQFGGANYNVQADAMIDSLLFKWTGVEALTMAIVALSLGWAPGTAPTATTDESLSQDYLFPVGGAFQVAASGNTPIDEIVTGGEIGIANALAGLYGSVSPLPAGMDIGRMSPTAKLTIKPRNLDFWRTTVTGTSSGTTPSVATVFGSFLVKFLSPSGAELTLKSQKCAWKVGYPKVDAKNGGTPDLTLEGTLVKPDSTTPVLEYIAKNAVASYT